MIGVASILKPNRVRAAAQLPQRFRINFLRDLKDKSEDTQQGQNIFNETVLQDGVALHGHFKENCVLFYTHMNKVYEIQASVENIQPIWAKVMHLAPQALHAISGGQTCACLVRQHLNRVPYKPSDVGSQPTDELKGQV